MKRITTYPKIDLQRNNEIFDEYTNDLHMENGWYPGNQRYNFNALLRLPAMAHTSLEEKSVLDVGCGTGDLFPLLSKQGIAEYMGIDLYEPYIEKARRHYPQETFILGDFLSYTFKKSFDFVYCSGGLTLKLSIDNYEFLRSSLEKMWKLSTIGIAFNVLIDEEDEQDPDLFFYSPEKVLQLCHEITSECTIGAERTPDVAQIHVYMYREE